MTGSQFPDSMTDHLATTGVIAVLMVDDVDNAVSLAAALAAGGVNTMELTLRTPVALDALRAIRRDVPQMLAGMGTMLTPEQVIAAADAGAAFGVSPGMNPRVVQAAKQANLPFAPGVATPSDVEAALELGCRLLKFFPAEPSGGLPYLKSMAAPFAHLGVRYIPLGGVSADNLSTYLSDEQILAVGGSWLAPRNLVVAKDWQAIQQRAQDASTAVKSIRSEDKNPSFTTPAEQSIGTER